MTPLVLYACTDLAYDQVFSPVEATPGVAPVLIADRQPRFLGGWRWRPYPPEAAALSPALANRWCKFFPERIFPEAEISIYVDANTLILADLTPLVAEFRASGAAIGLFPPRRARRHRGGARLRQGGGEDPARRDGDGRGAARGLPADGLPADAPASPRTASSSAATARRGSTRRWTLWWQELSRASKRDQLSLPYVLMQPGSRSRSGTGAT